MLIMQPLVTVVIPNYNGGENLFQFLSNKNNYTNDDVCKLVSEINILVEKSEDYGIYHNDLGNLANYTIRDGEVFLIDFGEAKIIESINQS